MKIGFIGMGNMASAIVRGFIQSKSIDSNQIYGYDICDFNLSNQIQRCQSSKELVENADVIFFAVKPNVLESVICEVKDNLKNKAVVSMVATYPFERLRLLLDESTRLQVIMPNTPANVQTGVTLFENNGNLHTNEYQFIENLFQNIGKVVSLPTYQMNGATAISGCGPAFVYMFIEAMADAGVKQGLPRDVAYLLTSQTLIGAGKMQQETNTHPGVLKDQVCSPGGLTIKGVTKLEEAGFRNAIIQAVNETISK